MGKTTGKNLHQRGGSLNNELNNTLASTMKSERSKAKTTWFSPRLISSLKKYGLVFSVLFSILIGIYIVAWGRRSASERQEILCKYATPGIVNTLISSLSGDLRGDGNDRGSVEEMLQKLRERELTERLERVEGEKRGRLSVFTPEYERLMHWGTYDPHRIASVTARTKNSIFVVMRWHGGANVRDGLVTREFGGSDFAFRWEIHDGQYYGRQTVFDPQTNLTKMTITFVKTPSGDAWNLLIDAQSADFVRYEIEVIGPFSATNINKKGSGNKAVYVPGGSYEPQYYGTTDRQQDEKGKEENFYSGEYKSLRHVFGRKFSKTGKTVLFRGALGNKSFDKVHRNYFNLTKDNKNKRDGILFDVDKYFEYEPTNFLLAGTIEYSSCEKDPTWFADGNKRTRALFGCNGKVLVNVGFSTRNKNSNEYSDFYPICQVLEVSKYREKAFIDRFYDVFFGGIEKGKRKVEAVLSETTNSLTTGVVFKMMEASLSNMLGGIGYWHGSVEYVNRSKDKNESQNNGTDPRKKRHAKEKPKTAKFDPYSMFASVPSREKFPRGFLWDEGFHQMLILKWNAEISKDIISHWMLSAQDVETGWIPREQIMDRRSGRFVPEEFVLQHPTHANPPSLALAIENIALSSLSKGKEADIKFLSSIMINLKRWLNWFHATQCGDCSNVSSLSDYLSMQKEDIFNNNKTLSYRWRSRNGFHILASGLDDYPRPLCRDPRKERHLDALSWVSFLSRTIEITESVLALNASKGNHFEKSLDRLNSNLSFLWENCINAVHWDSKANLFCDITGCPSKKSQDQMVGHFSPYRGYVNLFPIALMLISDEKKAKKTISMAKSALDSGFGLQSVSNNSLRLATKLEQRHENYWCGPIWMNINFLFLRGLKLKYISVVGASAEQTYYKIRKDLIINVAKEYLRTGKLWENYDQNDGHGRGTAPFTGWTSLITLIIAEIYD